MTRFGQAMADRAKFCFLHGFLGKPSDWEPVLLTLSLKTKDSWTPDLIHDPGLGPETPLSLWPQKFQSVLEGFAKPSSIILVGYSMGARLALTFLAEASCVLKGALLIAAHPGLSHDSQRQERRQNDQAWAHKLFTQNWDDWIPAWNAQEVFLNTQAFERNEKDFDKEKLHLALTQWSLAQQPNYLSRLSSIKTPLRWVVGENDHKFMPLYQQLHHENPLFNYQIVKNAGHRVLLDQPHRLSQLILDFASSSVL